MAASVTLEADGKGEIISGFLPHACPQLPHSQVVSLRFSPTMYTGESSYPLKVLPILQAASCQDSPGPAPAHSSIASIAS